MKLPETFFRAPETLSSSQRFQETAALLARAMWRVGRVQNCGSKVLSGDPEKSAKTALYSLDKDATQSVHADHENT